MKKIVLILTLVLTVTLISACGEGSDDTLRVGMDLSYPPFETEEDGEPYGISVDVAYELGEFLDREVEIIDTDFGTLINSLNSGEVDIIIGSMSITEEREGGVDFTNPYFYFRIINLVNQEYADANGLTEDSTVDDIDAISSTEFVGIADQVSYQIPEQRGFDVVEATDLSSAVYEVVQGTKDVLLMSPFPVANNHKANLDSTMIIYDSWEKSPIGMAVREGDADLLEDANAFIAQMESGGVYSRLRDSWDSEVQDSLGRSNGLDFFINEE